MQDIYAMPCIRTFEKEFLLEDKYSIDLQSLEVFALQADGTILRKVDFIITSIGGKIILRPISNEERFFVKYQRYVDAKLVFQEMAFFPKNVIIKIS